MTWVLSLPFPFIQIHIQTYIIRKCKRISQSSFVFCISAKAIAPNAASKAVGVVKNPRKRWQRCKIVSTWMFRPLPYAFPDKLIDSRYSQRTFEIAACQKRKVSFHGSHVLSFDCSIERMWSPVRNLTKLAFLTSLQLHTTFSSYRTVQVLLTRRIEDYIIIPPM